MALQAKITPGRRLARVLLALIGLLAASAAVAFGFHAAGDAMIAQARASRYLTSTAIIGAITAHHTAGKDDR